MNTGLRISVVLCTYNGQAYLAEQLLTLLTQNRLPDEVIIGDDASSDRTREIVEEFAAMAKTRGIAVYVAQRPERSGYVSNFSQSLAMASGNLVFLCDQDDAWHADKVSLMEQRFVAEPGLTLLHTDARLVDSDGADLGVKLFEALELSDAERERVATGQAFEVYLRRNIATGATTAFRRDLLEMALPIAPTWIHDAWLAVVAAATGTVGIFDDPLIDYRQHGANQIGMRRRTWRTRMDEFTLPREDELRAEVLRLDALSERLRAVNASGQAMAHLSARRHHVERRILLGRLHPVRRLPMIAWEWFGGAYARFDTGYRTALRDLMRKG